MNHHLDILPQVLNQGRTQNPTALVDQGRYLLLLKQLILHLSALASDYPITEQEAEWRAASWSMVFKPDQIDSKYLHYTIKACLASRAERNRKGPIHADEFMDIFLIVRSGQVWAPVAREWKTVRDLICDIYEQSPQYELQRETQPDMPPAVFEKIKAQIYGWED